MKKVVKNSKGQVWIETVVYTLIAFAILGAVLGFAKPKIEELQDKAVIEQSILMLENIDGIIEEIKTVQGNKREIELGIKKGSLTIDSENDQIIFRYCNEDAQINYNTNPNGALENIAGVCNNNKNVFGMMPHPERAVDEVLNNTDGRAIFESLLNLVSI